MPSPFNITVPSNTALLNEKRQAQVTFTVTNQSGRSLRGRAQIKSEKAEANTWFAIDGDSERDFAIGETKQFSVRIAAPNTAPVGFAPFRLDMVDVANPDENFTQGPTVTFQVPAAQPKPSFPWWIILIVLVLLAVIGGVIFFLTRGDGVTPGPTLTPTITPTTAPTSTPTTTPVPNVVMPALIDLPFNEAQAALLKAGLRVGRVTKQGTLTKKSDVVLDQNPHAGIVVGPNTPVDLTVEATVLFQKNQILWMDFQGLDLETGNIGSAGNVDLVLIPTVTGFPPIFFDRTLELTNGGAVIHAAPDRLAACRDVLRAAQRSIPVPPGSSLPLCVLTHSNHIAAVTVVSQFNQNIPPGAGIVLINVIVWGD